jgi:hypothetical protein
MLHIYLSTVINNIVPLGYSPDAQGMAQVL